MPDPNFPLAQPERNRNSEQSFQTIAFNRLNEGSRLIRIEGFLFRANRSRRIYKRRDIPGQDSIFHRDLERAARPGDLVSSPQ
jgi:hypothetical protein